MPYSRRTFLKAGAGTISSAAAVSIFPARRPLLVKLGAHPEPVPPIDDPRLKTLTQRGLDTASSAGATYADIRLTHMRWRDVGTDDDVNDGESMTVGIRALVDGYWGFAASPIWSVEEMTRLGKEAVLQAKANVLGKPRQVDLAPVAAVEGTWMMPVKIDPFDVNPMEMQDFLMGTRYRIAQLPTIQRVEHAFISSKFLVQSKVFASTIGSYCAQQVYWTEGMLKAEFSNNRVKGKIDVDLEMSLAGVGWEMFRERDLVGAVQRDIEEQIAILSLPAKPVDVGRYDVVLDAKSVGAILSSTIGQATELDRALGYEANASGTSYLNDPLAMLDTFKVGSPLLNVIANRNEVEGAATVKWDDEGVIPESFSLVKEGILTDYMTNREAVGWIRPAYERAHRPIRSHGCSFANAGVEAPYIRPPNLVMTPGQEQATFDDCIKHIGKGIAFTRVIPSMDFQQLNGLGVLEKLGHAVEIKDGKPVAQIAGAGFLFRAPELWKSLLFIGGAESMRRYGYVTVKGEPSQWARHSVTAAPAVFKDVTVIDLLRKA